MTLEEYFLQNKFEPLPYSIDDAAKVYEQAARHNFRDQDSKFFDKRRPTEPINIKEWRKENRINLSCDIPNLFVNECLTLIKSNHFIVSDLNEKLSDYLNNEKIYSLGNSLSFDEWFFQEILPNAVIDANAFYVSFPYSTNENILIPRDISALDPVGIEHKIVSHDKIKKLRIEKPGGYFCFCEKEIINNKTIDVYYIADNMQWYRAYQEGTTLKYELWYNHDLGYIPAKILPGVPTRNKKGQQYQETLLKSAYNYLDTFSTSLDDDMVMRAKGSHQILVMPEVACNKCSGQKFITEDNKRVPCTSCDGTGKMRTPGPADTFVIPRDTMGDNAAASPIYFVGPDIGSLKHSFETTWAFYDKAANTKGIDAIQKVAESGEAMKMRLLKNEAAINEVYQLIGKMYEFALNCIDGYLYPKPQDRIKVIVSSDIRIQLKTPELLKIYYNEALPIEKCDAALDYFKIKYKNDPKKYKKYEILIKYFPVSMKDNAQDIQYDVGLGITTEEDVINSRYANEALDIILEDENNLIKDNITLYKLAKQKISEIRNTQSI